jgi:dipeptidyl aminopeptidase/acylaminoacyl peptidase
MRSSSCFMGCAGLALAMLMAAPVLADTLRPYTIDEMFKIEDLGPGVFSPSGDALVYAQKPPFSELPDYSIPFWARFFGRLMSAPVKGAGPAQPLFEASDALYDLLSFSPDGRYVAYFQAKDGTLSLGVFDRKTGANRAMAAAPEQNESHELLPIWIAPQTIVYAAADPHAVGPYSPYLQRASGEALYRAWHKSWEGREPSYSLYQTRATGGDNPPFPGSLLAVDVRTGETRKLADGLFSDLRLSPDGRFLSGLQQFVRSQMPADRLGPPWIYGRTRLVLFDLKTGRRIDVAPDLDVFPGTLEWSPRAAQVGFFAWRGGRSPREGRFHTFDTRTGRLRVLPHVGLDLVNEREFGPPGLPMRFVWMGNDIAVAARTNRPPDPTPRFTSRGVTGRDLNEDAGRFDWYLLGSSAPRNLTASYEKVSPWAAGVTASGTYLVLDDEVQRIDSRGFGTKIAPGERVMAKPVARAGINWWVREAFGTTALYASSDATHPHLLVFDLLKGRARKVPLPKGTAKLVAVNSATGAIAYRETHIDGSDLKLQSADGQAREVTRINQFLATVAKPIARSVTHAGPNGESLRSCLTLPPDYQPGHRYPTLVFVYPESTPDCADTSDLQRVSYGNLNVFVAQGYVVLRVANPGISTRAGGPLDGIVAATDRALDAAIAAGYVDGQRLALIGASGAGFSGLWIAGHSTRFKALVSINGIADILSHYFTIGLPEYFFPDLGSWDGQARRYEGVEQFGIGRTPWDDPDFFWRISPIAYAKAIDVPVLLVGTDMDTGGFSQQYDEMFVALHRLRKDVDYVKYWGEGHGPSSAANLRDLTARTSEWLDRYLRR